MTDNPWLFYVASIPTREKTLIALVMYSGVE